MFVKINGFNYISFSFKREHFMTMVICKMNLNVYFHGLIFENQNEVSGVSHGMQKIDLEEQS